MTKWFRRWWNGPYDCNSRGIIDYLRANGHHAAARDVEALFRDIGLRSFVEGKV